MLKRLQPRLVLATVLALTLTAAGSAPAAERPAEGGPTPGFSLPAAGGATVDLAALRGRERAVVVFFRGSW
jgi:hypothetical protein